MASPALLGLLAMALVLGSQLPLAAAPKAARKAPPKKAALVEGAGVIVTLKTGTLIEGIYHGDADGAVWVEVDGGEVGIEKDTIARIVPAKKVGAVEYKERAAALDAKDAEGWWELSLWATGKEMHGAAEHAAKNVLKIDPNHSHAREHLGFEKVGDRWLQGDQIPAAKGLVLYDRKWMTPAQAAEQAAADEKRRKDAENAYTGALMRPPDPSPTPQPRGGWVDWALRLQPDPPPPPSRDKPLGGWVDR